MSIIGDYTRWYQGKLSNEKIRFLVGESFMHDGLFKINKLFEEGQQKMEASGMKPKTFAWVLGTYQIKKQIEKKFGIKMKIDWKKEYLNGGLKLIFEILISKLITLII